MVLLRKELLEVLPSFIWCGILVLHFSWLYVEDHGQHHVVGVVDDLGGRVRILNTIWILNAIVNTIKVIVDGNCCVQYLTEYLLVLLEVFFCYFSVSVHEMMDNIDVHDSYEPCVPVVEFKNASVPHVIYHLVLSSLSMVKLFSYIWRCLLCLLLTCWRWAAIKIYPIIRTVTLGLSMEYLFTVWHTWFTSLLGQFDHIFHPRVL